MKIIFVSGPYRGNIAENIQKAKEASIQLWQDGYAVITPHLNTAHFDGYCPDEVWLAGDLEILRRCDVIFMLPGWEQSEGAMAEHALAEELGKEIMYG